MSKALATKNVAAVLLGLGLVLALSFSFATPAKADVISDLQAQIQALLAQITALQGGTGSQQTGGLVCPAGGFTQTLTIGSTGSEVMAVQKFLNSIDGTQLATTGAGSPGNETSYFGSITRAAVSKFQQKYGITPTAGYWGPISRAKANSLCSAAPTPGTPTPTPTGPGITVSAGTQPANSLAPQGGARVPFTTFMLTNNSGAVVTITGVTVQRVGLAQDAAFSGVVLVDSNSVQLGTSKTLNSNHQAVIGDTFTLNPGETKILTVAGNMAAALTAYAGQVASFSVVGISTSVPVNGSLPITGASQTLNSSLAIGSVSTSTSAFDPGAAQTKNIGDTNIRFSGVKFTAGSVEDLKLYSIRWRQVGSVSSGDLANVMTYVDGVAYPVIVSPDGKYFTTIFPGGLLIAKGFSKDIYIQGDVVGSGSSARTVDFDLDKVTDVYFVGQLFGYGIAPSGTYTPWYNGYVVTLAGASVTTIGKANEVPAQNIANNVPNQPLGGFVTDIKGEAISVQSLIISVATTSTGVGFLTNVSILDENGVVVGGPVDASGAGTTLTFTDNITFPTGRHVYTIKGKIPSAFTNGGTVVLSSTPSSQWTTVTGQTTGNSITLTNGAFTMNTMTVKAAALAVAISSTPAAQNVVAGSQGLTFANVQFDASQSGEDIRFSAVAMTAGLGTQALEGAYTDMTSCQLFDGATALNGGSNVVNPSGTASSTAVSTFTFDNTLTVAKGTVKTLALKCNLSSSAATDGQYNWGISAAQIGAIAATGVTSGATVTATGAVNNGQVMTVGSGTLTVVTDSSSPSYAIAAAGSTGVTLGIYKFRATNDPVNLNRIGLKFTGTSASSSAADLTGVTLWSGGVQIGTAQFVGSNRNATSTLNSPLVLPKDTDVLVTVKGDLATQGPSAASLPGALLLVDVDVNTNTQGTGAQSGATVNATFSGSTVSGVRVFRSYPTVAKQTSGMSSTLIAQSGIDLYRFSVTANAKGDIALKKLMVNIATSSVSTTNGTTSVTNLLVKAYTDSAYSNGVPGFTDGQVVTTVPTLVSNGNNAAVLSSTLTIPAGSTYYFKVIGDVAQAAGSTGSAGSVTTKIVGDATYPPALVYLLGIYTGILDTGNNFVWSPLSTTTTGLGVADWTNGYQVPGLPSGGTDSWTLTK